MKYTNGITALITDHVSVVKFNVSYLIGAGGAYAGKATGLNVVPVVYTVTKQ